jgi:hypothetical protein
MLPGRINSALLAYTDGGIETGGHLAEHNHAFGKYPKN